MDVGGHAGLVTGERCVHEPRGTGVGRHGRIGRQWHLPKDRHRPTAAATRIGLVFRERTIGEQRRRIGNGDRSPPQAGLIEPKLAGQKLGGSRRMTHG